MPRDNMASRIQKIAQQARLTFRKNGSSSQAGSSNNNKTFLENVNKLTTLLSEIRAEDLKITPRASGPFPAPVSVPHNPPVTYMHICETDAFSMGVFLLKSGACIPLHDHPGMNGMLKVLYGRVSISGFDKLDSGGGGTKKEPAAVMQQFNPPPPYQKDALRRALLRSVGEFNESSGPCLLSPYRDNLHQISAVDGPAAFLDILAPPYDPDDGRDCHYYKLMQPAAGSELQGGQVEEGTVPREVWLLEIPQPADFWCGGEPYPGPRVSV
ncbi:2-aminoethanethiol dioxygenase [Microcaecilia unicolor]|uniref:2-aminoethanethiol dioxygenase n=1 Tax=Microcaecilia unicolor TaxID=1415580 RepID=A0A6P7Y1K5_9AMPH|nr:2-aminoethanethiol dioxygenase [Microcaecilia unicolor]